VIRVDTELVSVNVSVVDRGTNRGVNNLSKGDFVCTKITSRKSFFILSLLRRPSTWFCSSIFQVRPRRSLS